ncbi:hypothetical protein ACIBI4_02035 [Streptomyces sp. NPDC050418]
MPLTCDGCVRQGGDPRMNTFSDLGRLAQLTVWVPGRIAHGS